MQTDEVRLNNAELVNAYLRARGMEDHPWNWLAAGLTDCGIAVVKTPGGDLLLAVNSDGVTDMQTAPASPIFREGEVVQVDARLGVVTRVRPGIISVYTQDGEMLQYVPAEALKRLPDSALHADQLCFVQQTREEFDITLPS